MTLPIGLTNQNVYLYMQVRKTKELNKSGPECKKNIGTLAGVIGILAVIMILGGVFIPQYDQSGNITLESLGTVRVVEGSIASIAFIILAVGIFDLITNSLDSSRKLKEIKAYLLNFPQKQDSLGIIGMENLLGGSQRKDLLIRGFESQFPKNALKELNFEQLIILYKECPESFKSKQDQIYPFFKQIFLELEKFLALEPEQLGMLLNDINQQIVLSDEHLLNLLFRYLSEPQFKEKSVQSALTTLYRKFNTKLSDQEFQEMIDQLRDFRLETVIDLKDI